MKRKELKALNPIVPSTYIKREAAKSNTKYQRFFMAAVENKILKVAIFKKDELRENIKSPAFMIYINLYSSEWITYDGDWLTAKIENLRGYYGTGEGWYKRDKNYASEKTIATINEYLATGKKLDPQDAIMEFQNRIRRDALGRKHSREMEAIDSVMNAVPKLPKDFGEWILDVPLRQKRYLFYKTKEKEAYCTACEKSMKIQKKYLHRTEGKCPTCGKEVIFLSWGKQKSVKDNITAGIIQRLTDDSGYIYRRFKMYIRSEKSNDYVMTVDDGGYLEEDRYRLNDDFVGVEYFEWGEYKYSGHYRWCHELNHGYYYDYRTDECMLYTRNLKRMLKETNLKWMDLNEMIESDRYCEPMKVMRNLIKNPKIELLFKTGAKRMARDAMREGYSGRIKLDNEKKTPWGVLNVKKEQYKEIVRYQMDEKCIAIQKKLNERGTKMNPDTIVFFRHLIGANIDTILDIGHFEKMRRYMKEIGATEHARVAGDYIDYIDDLKNLSNLGELVISKSMLFPQDFQKTHTEMSLLLVEKKNKIDRMKVREQNKKLQKMTKRFEKMYKVEDDIYTLLFPNTKAEFQKEGREMHNCVGGYFENVLRGACVVAFIRKKDKEKESFVTVEFREGTICQCRAACNADAPKEAWKFAEKAAKHYKREIAKELREEKKSA